jgi:hypothetical protein
MLAFLKYIRLASKNFAREKQGTLGRISTIDLLVPTTSDQLLFKLIFPLFAKQAFFLRRSTVVSLPLQ